MKTRSGIVRGLVLGSAFITFAILIVLVGYIILKGVPHLNAKMFEPVYTTENVSMMPAIVTTLIVVVLSLLVATPLGVFTGFYLVEYAKKGSKVVEIIRLTTETLSGIPSILYGLFGMLFFSIALSLGYSILSGVFTLAIMILPLIIRSTEEALLAVDNSLRNGSFALGAGKLRTIIRVVLPVATPGILSGVILAIGRCVGETAALMFTLGTTTDMPKSLLSSGRTLSLHMYVLSTEGLFVNEAFATGFVLIVVTLLINGLSTYIGNKLAGGNN
ncbi:Phosphate transport system permease protein pstA [Aedoeadaptatus ivorii]|uniref:Phosphate transport system permease protein PstA n=1 Tax=Aedoeadaptatus ivorii TaxID=54006 RepID=A0A3S4ZQG0_9FIRM|nr:phosphate ABC transporter permease PstA [Peptoniphilus ivorii]VEJ35409.1 Phosphate transport system permease protein pstA [Peptoniphilus ivorii]